MTRAVAAIRTSTCIPLLVVAGERTDPKSESQLRLATHLPFPIS
jgi:hypothetical protein